MKHSSGSDSDEDDAYLVPSASAQCTKTSRALSIGRSHSQDRLPKTSAAATRLSSSSATDNSDNSENSIDFTPQIIGTTHDATDNIDVFGPHTSPEIVIRRAPDFVIDDFEDFTYLGRLVKGVRSQERSGQHAFYTVLFHDEHTDKLSRQQVLDLEGGQEALDAFDEDEVDSDSDHLSDEVSMSSTRPRAKRQRVDYVDLTELDELLDEGEPTRKRPRLRLRTLRQSASLSNDAKYRTRSSSSKNGLDAYNSDESLDILQSDVHPPQRFRVRGPRRSYAGPDGIIYEHQPQRSWHPVRSTRHRGPMEEIGEDKIDRSDSESRPIAPKAIGARESFKPLPRTDPFRNRHMQHCELCGQGSNFSPLIHCQGCTMSYHKSCLGNRSSREHLVTKVGDGDFVLQCRRCVRFVQKKEATAPDQSRCQGCRLPGLSCAPFRERKTTLQEQKERETNGGEDPIYAVPSSLLNQTANILFRCTACYRGFHFAHLPSTASRAHLAYSSPSLALDRFEDRSRNWKCADCNTMPGKFKSIVAWKPLDEDTYNPSIAVDELSEDDKAYLIRWENKSYFRVSWMPGAWVWGLTNALGGGGMRRAFFKRDEAKLPKMRTEDAVPEDYLRTDIVLDVKYTSVVDADGFEIDKARIREVKEALIKFKGLGYEDAVWEVPPVPEDEERWMDFVTAYNDWAFAKYIHVPKAGPLKSRLGKARSQAFDKLEKKKQPDSLTGGELMKYQLEGVNWLYYKWFNDQNAVLADEMGLGKTIQIIGLLATLVSDWNCFPFLVVVPNATCANWRREIKRWAPELRVVAHFGSQVARDTAYRYELFPRSSKDLRCHVVVTSFDAASDQGNQKFLSSVPWQALIVDEGQRLKSDKTLLYNALTSLNIPFRILLTGTPLQNNIRELFNLLHFLDDSFDPPTMEAEYENLDNKKVVKLHDMIRPYFLRRTKAQVLTFLPPMAQIILPVSMSLVQKKLYRSIFAKNPDLLRALFKERRDLRTNEKGPLSSLLMQLRKCLCHPFVYNKSIEERNVANSHRNLVEASGKLQLLEVLLPKLQARGHRVLLFSQFLDMLTMVEDFLEGLGMLYHRLDGTMNSMQKQRRIDEFNAPGSEYFAFLLSTRAGGVGINLATADTVIILDPDFNPHQDIQALSRAHRIGQQKKVLCFQLVTRASAEEKIMQIGRKKLALDHVLIEQMDAEDASDQDLTSILRHGAAELFADDGEKDVKYDDAEIDKLIDRSQIENTRAGEDKSTETQFSHARIWANADLEDAALSSEGEQGQSVAESGLWDKILREREKLAAAEAAAQVAAYGRGRRTKQVVDYGVPADKQEHDETGTVVATNGTTQDTGGEAALRLKVIRNEDDNDTDFHASDGEGSDHDDEPDPREVDQSELLIKVKKVKPNKGKSRKVIRIKFHNPARLRRVFELVGQALKHSSRRSAKIGRSKINAVGTVALIEDTYPMDTKQWRRDFSFTDAAASPGASINNVWVID